MEMELVRTCISCKKDVANDTGNVHFLCPNCNKYEIIRCKHCREIVAKFVCPECNFEGPN
ncbi:RNA-binding protein [Candidatus Woesearchaeota archaeon]|nr:MAG: RNA-binding protein [Candidatus Woesearchaeota archaeon]